MKRVHLIITGDVQGVGYRSWARSSGVKYGLTGTVKNREDGSVEIIAEGTEQILRDYITACRNGPEVSLVTGISESWSAATGEFMTFDVLY